MVITRKGSERVVRYAFEMARRLGPLESIRRTDATLKGPLTTPVGKGFRSINVSLRRTFDLYANVRPVVTMPGTKAHYENIDIITVRENTEGAYLASIRRADGPGKAR